MKWDMEIEEIEAVLEKIWDIHDKLSDTIHSISRNHFLNSIKALTRPARKGFDDSVEDNRDGYVFVKGFRIDDNDLSIQEAKSLNGIRTALENLEDQLEFFHTIHIQQRAERDVAIARLEQSRIVLAMRLAEHHGKKYKVIEEALAFVGDVDEASRFLSPENLYRSLMNPSGGKFNPSNEKRPNKLINFLVSSFNFAKNSLRFDHMTGILGNAAVFTISMVAMLHLNQVVNGEQRQQKKGDNFYDARIARRTVGSDESSGDGSLNQLDVLMARG